MSDEFATDASANNGNSTSTRFLRRLEEQKTALGMVGKGKNLHRLTLAEKVEQKRAEYGFVGSGIDIHLPVPGEVAFDDDLIPVLPESTTEYGTDLREYVKGMSAQEAIDRLTIKLPKPRMHVSGHTKFRCPNPQHEDNVNSASYNAQNRTWFCHGTCEVGGSNIDLFAYAHNYGDPAPQFPRVMDALKTHLGWVDPTPVADAVDPTHAARERVAPGPSGAASPSTPATPEEEDSFWNSRPELAHIREFARARMASPWATLGVALVRCVHHVPPYYQLPPTIGSHVSVNLFLGIVAASGGGKGAANGAATDALDLMREVYRINLGSGEGIHHQYMKVNAKKEPEQYREAVLFDVAEVDTIASLNGRNGSTLLPELRKAWMGESLGFAYADAMKRLPVPEHSYRFGLVVGIQPESGGAKTLLDDATGGTPQRFLWLPGYDPSIPDQVPEEPKPYPWTCPTEANLTFTEIPVCQVAQDVIRTEHRKRMRGQGGALDGHALLNRLKWAFALALYNERVEVREDDWELAAVLIRISDVTRDAVVDAMHTAASKQNRSRAEHEAERALVVADRIEDVAVKKACSSVLKKLKKEGDWFAANDLGRSLRRTHGPNLDRALDMLLASNQIESEEVTYHGVVGTRYRTVGE